VNIMTWSWSHTNEAYANGRANLADLSREELLEILGEWQYADMEAQIARLEKELSDAPDELERRLASIGDPSFDVPEHYKSLPDDILADLIWRNAEEQALCDNGGYHLWVCPDGCHTVSVDREGGAE
jgi:hypothetical protein